MPKSVIIYHADQEMIGKHIRYNEWVMFSGKPGEPKLMSTFEKEYCE